jgi:hypothetical protein
MMARMSGTPFGLIFMIIAQILIAVLGLNPDEFELCRANEFDLASLPDWARILIESIPFAGDLFAMIAPTICIRTGCEPPNVEQHGLLVLLSAPCLGGQRTTPHNDAHNEEYPSGYGDNPALLP